MQTGTGFCSVLAQREESPGQMGKVNEGNGPTGGPHQRPRDLRNGAKSNVVYFLGGHTCKTVLVVLLCLTLGDPRDCSPPGSSVHGDSPGKNTGVGCYFILQGIFQS